MPRSRPWTAKAARPRRGRSAAPRSAARPPRATPRGRAVGTKKDGPPVTETGGPSLASARPRCVAYATGRGARKTARIAGVEQVDVFPSVRIASLVHAMTTIAELRAVLAPLLDDPYEERAADWLDDSDAFDRICRFCGAEAEWRRVWTGNRDSRGRKINRQGDVTRHDPACPVLRKDALLGRAPADQRAEEAPQPPGGPAAAPGDRARLDAGRQPVDAGAERVAAPHRGI